MKYLFILSLFIFCLAVTNADCQNKPQTLLPQTLKQSKDADAFIERLKKPEHLNILQGALWTLTHDYKDFKHMNEILKSFQSYLEAIGKYERGDGASLEQMGGIKAFKDKLAEWLKDDDQSIRAFSAAVLGISGDKNYAPQVASLLKEGKHKADDLIFYDRARALMALGLMGAKEYLPQIVSLLQSKNEYDRSGAITALNYLGAKEYAKDVANILINKDFQLEDEPSPIYFLIETETAKDYKKELVEVMLGEFRSESSKAAMYALVHLESKENAKDIAKLLTSEFRKDDAVKALALLNAKEYCNEIASLLDDENSLVRKDVALALGILKAKNHSNKVAGLLKGKEDFVRYYAAVSLILMEAKEYYKEAIPIVEKSHQSGAYLNEEDFHPLILEKYRQINGDFKMLLEQANNQIKK